MAKEHEEHREHERSGGKKKKLHLHAITTRKMPDGTYVHEHHYKDHEESEHTHPPRMMGTSHDLDDVHQHIEDNFGGEQQGEEAGGGGEPEPGAQPGVGAPEEEEAQA